jgi:sulfate adenylyltransferase
MSAASAAAADALRTEDASASSSAAAAASTAADSSTAPQTHAVARGADGLARPHGAAGELVDLLVRDPLKRKALLESCTATQELSERGACDVELLTVGAFSPLTGFLPQQAYESVVETSRLPSGELLGLPIVLDTDNPQVAQVGARVRLTFKGQDLAVLEVESAWRPNKAKEAKHCYGTSSLEHPGVQMIAQERGNWYLGGKLHGLELPKRAFPCLTPREVRAMLLEKTAAATKASATKPDVVAFQCRNPIHRAHYELFTRALTASNVSQENAVVLVHPTQGPTQDDDIPASVRYHTYEVLKKEIADDRVQWAYLPYSMHMAGPREAVQHMILRKNFGCTHFIVGRDMAGSKSCLTGEDFYGMYDAQLAARKAAEELGMRTVQSQDVVFTEEKGYVEVGVAKKEGLHVKKLSGTKFRQMLRGGEEIPEWFAFKSVVGVLREHQAKQK